MGAEKTRTLAFWPGRQSVAAASDVKEAGMGLDISKRIV